MMARANPRNPMHLIAFGFGTGFAPVAPGTVGTLLGIPLFLLLAPLPLAYYLVVVAGLFALGVWVCGRVSRDLGTHDHEGIVWDEIVGLLVALTAVPVEIPVLVAGFVLFRVVDVLKPWPIRWLDRRIGGGLGIMADDLAAGVVVAVLMQILLDAGLL